MNHMFNEFIFFFKQKTAYEMLRSLVGSEMCIRDRCSLQPPTLNRTRQYARHPHQRRYPQRRREHMAHLSLIHI